MQTELITDKHRDFLKEDFGLTFEEIDAMPDEEYDEFLVKLAMIECDEVTPDDEITERGQTATEIMDILNGPYDDDDEDEDDEDE